MILDEFDLILINEFWSILDDFKISIVGLIFQELVVIAISMTWVTEVKVKKLSYSNTTTIAFSPTVPIPRKRL